MRSDYRFLKNFEDVEAYWFEMTNVSPALLQLSRGSIDFEVRIDDFDGLILSWVRSEGRQLWRDALEDDGVHFGYVLSSAGPVQVGGNDIKRTDAMLWPKGEQVDYLLEGPLVSLEFSVSQDLADVLGWSATRQPVREVAETALDELTHRCSIASQWLRSREGQPENLLHPQMHVFRDWVLEGLEVVMKPWTEDASGGHKALPNARHHDIVRAAEKRTNLLDPDSMGDAAALAAELGISRRSLFYSFQKVLGVGPRRFFELQRLHALRRDLARHRPEEVTVTALAHQNGFTQLGRMAGLYRQHFGESPRKTLGR